MSDHRPKEPKVSRDVTREYDLAEAAVKHFRPMQDPGIVRWQMSAFQHGYAQALLDVQDGKVKL